MIRKRKREGIWMLYEKLSERKKELGMTTEQLSQLSGVPVGTINKILSGETRSPRYATWQALERVLYGAGGSETGSAEESRNVRGDPGTRLMEILRT